MSDLSKLEKKVENLEQEINGLNIMLSVLVAELVNQGISAKNIGDTAIAVATTFENSEGYRKQGEALNHMVETMLEVVEKEQSRKGT